jgi:SPP1 gp7 family putative phage head morphogenesis protein
MTAIERASGAHTRQIFSVYDEARRKTVAGIKDLYRNYYKDDKGFDMQALRSIAPSGDVWRFHEEMKRLGLSSHLPEEYAGRMTRLELLNAQMWGEMKKVGFKQNLIQSKSHAATINDAYYKTIYDTAKGIGATPSFSHLNTRTVSTILNSRFQGKNYSDRIWANTDALAKQLKGKLGAAIASGQAPSKTISEIQQRFGVGKFYAERLVRTETNYFENKAELESYDSMGIKRFVFVATLDGRTSEICQSYDGKTFSVSEAKQGTNAPPLHPNCRSTIRPYIGKEWEPEARIARDPRTGQNQYIYNQSFPQWAKANGIVNTPTFLSPSFVPRGANPVQYRVGDQHYQAMGDILADAPQSERDLYYAHESELRVANPLYAGQSKFIPNQGVMVNIVKDAKGSRYSVPYRTTFHELGHNIDFVAGGNAPFSHTYKDGLFAKTLRAEASSIVDKIQQSIRPKSVDGIIKPVTRAQAYSTLSSRLRRIKAADGSFISDIFSGATNNRAVGLSGHSSSYWGASSMRLPAEAFTQMFSAGVVNPNGLKLIKQYFPESYKVYQEMIKEMVNGKM